MMNLNEDSLNYKVKNVKKISYRGKFRIVGQIVRSLQDKKPIGFLIMNDETDVVKDYGIDNTLWIMQNYGIINAIYEDDKIKCTEGSMDNLMKYDINIQRISEPKIMILNEVLVKEGEPRLFKVLDTDLTVMPRFYTEDEVIKLANSLHSMDNAPIVNAKIVKGTGIVANVTSKKNRKKDDEGFPKIEQVEVEVYLKKKNENAVLETEQSLERKAIHRQKLINAAPNILYRYFTAPSPRIHHYVHYRSIRGSRDYYVKDDLRIILEEILIPMNKENEEKYRVFLQEIKRMKNSELEDSFKYCEIMQYMVYLPDVEEKLKNKLQKAKDSYYYYSDGKEGYIYRSLVKVGKACDKLQELSKYYTAKVYKTYDAYANAQRAKRGYGKKDSHNILKNTNFAKGNEIAQLGYTISAKHDGGFYTSENGGKYHLKYIGNNIPDFDQYAQYANCFGDLYCIAAIEKQIDLYNNKNLYSYYENESALDADVIYKKIEMLLGILAIFRPDIAKIYVKRRISKVNFLRGVLPNYNFDVVSDYKLSANSKKYYESGFNAYPFIFNVNDMPDCFLSNRSGGIYKASRAVLFTRDRQERHKGELLDLRHILGIEAKLNPRLLSDLANALALITSSKCDTEFINDNIGYLRYV